GLERRKAGDRAEFQVLSPGDQQDRGHFGYCGSISSPILLAQKQLVQMTKAPPTTNQHMSSPRDVAAFLAAYPERVPETAGAARRLLARVLPRIAETLDESAKLIGYNYGPGYKGVVCTLIMSQTGVKLGIMRGSELPDPNRLMKGSGKVHRHVPLRSVADL